MVVTADFLVEQISTAIWPGFCSMFWTTSLRLMELTQTTDPAVGFDDNERFTRATQVSKVSTR